MLPCAECAQWVCRGAAAAAAATRDFVDYDANLLAVAAGVTDQERSKLVLGRVDSGHCSHSGVGTFVSEKLYESGDCNNGNTGDSEVSMGRISYFDGLARQAVGDMHGFERLTWQPLQQQLLENTWMPERYSCSGAPLHSAYFFEFPAVVAVLQRDVRYGIRNTLTDVEVCPLTSLSSFHYSSPSTSIRYSPTSVCLQTPGDGPRTLSLHVRFETQLGIHSARQQPRLCGLSQD